MANLLDDTRYLFISPEEYDYINSKVKKKNLQFISNMYNNPSFRYTRYNVSIAYPTNDGELSNELSDTFGTYGDGLSDNLPEKLGHFNRAPIKSIINVLEISRDSFRLRIINSSPEVNRKSIGRFIFTYQKKGLKNSVGKDVQIDIVPIDANDPWSTNKKSGALCHTIITILLYKLHMESVYGLTRLPFKYGPNVSKNVVYFNQNDYLDLADLLEKKKFKIVQNYALEKLDLVIENIADSDITSHVRNSYFVLDNNELRTFIAINSMIMSYIGSTLQCEGIVEISKNTKTVKSISVNKEKESLFGYEDVKENFRNLIKGHLASELFDDPAQQFLYYNLLPYLYIMDRMSKPKKLLDVDTSTKLDKANTPKKSSKKSEIKEDIDRQISIIIKDTDYILPSKPVKNPGSGTKHSYEYTKKGCWCTIKKTGKRYWRRSSVCCKGRGNPATHVYKIEGELTDENT